MKSSSNGKEKHVLSAQVDENPVKSYGKLISNKDGIKSPENNKNLETSLPQSSTLETKNEKAILKAILINTSIALKLIGVILFVVILIFVQKDITLSFTQSIAFSRPLLELLAIFAAGMGLLFLLDVIQSGIIVICVVGLVFYLVLAYQGWRLYVYSRIEFRHTKVAGKKKIRKEYLNDLKKNLETLRSVLEQHSINILSVMKSELRPVLQQAELFLFIRSPHAYDNTSFTQAIRKCNDVMSIAPSDEESVLTEAFQSIYSAATENSLLVSEKLLNEIDIRGVEALIYLLGIVKTLEECKGSKNVSDFSHQYNRLFAARSSKTLYNNILTHQDVYFQATKMMRVIMEVPESIEKEILKKLSDLSSSNINIATAILKTVKEVRKGCYLTKVSDIFGYMAEAYYLKHKEDLFFDAAFLELHSFMAKNLDKMADLVAARKKDGNDQVVFRLLYIQNVLEGCLRYLHSLV